MWCEMVLDMGEEEEGRGRRRWKINRCGEGRRFKGSSSSGRGLRSKERKEKRKKEENEEAMP